MLTRMLPRSQTESDVTTQRYAMQRDAMQHNAGNRLNSTKKGSAARSKAVIVLSEEKGHYFSLCIIPSKSKEYYSNVLW